MRVMLYVAVGFNLIFKLLQFYDCLKIVQLTPIYKQSNFKNRWDFRKTTLVSAGWNIILNIREISENFQWVHVKKIIISVDSENQCHLHVCTDEGR